MYEAVSVKPMAPWRLQKTGEARDTDNPRKAARGEQSQAKKTWEPQPPEVPFGASQDLQSSQFVTNYQGCLK